MTSAAGIDTGRDLLDELARADLTLWVTQQPLRSGPRRVLGAWDPLLRRIELYEVAARSDRQLLATLLHELAHARGVFGESEAAELASAALANLDESQLAAAAQRVRGLALPARSHEDRLHHP